MLIDSDVLVWLTRGHPGAAARLSTISHWQISIVTYMELAQGCRNKSELAQTKKGLTLANTHIIGITEPIAQHAANLIDQFALSHGLRLADALIAATALEHQLPLLTANAKQFSSIPALNIETFSV